MSGRAGSGRRVAILTSVHPPFDPRIFYREAVSAAAAGFEVTVLAPGAPRTVRDGVRVAPIPAVGRGRWARPLRWPLLFVRALRMRADLYHFHDPELLPWGLLLKWTARRPVIYDSHEYFPESLESKHWIPRPLRRPASRLAAIVEREVARRLDGVVAVTEDMAERFRRVQPNSVAVMNFPPAPEEEPPPYEAREEAVVYAGLMNPERGITIVPRVAELLRRRRPEARLRLLGRLDRWPVSPELPDPSSWSRIGVDVLGVVPFPEVRSHLHRARVGWLPLDPRVPNSRRAWPIKLAEYMAAGLPIVASDLPIPARVIREFRCGIVVPGLDPEAHAEALAYLLEHPSEAAEMGRRGFEAARTRFSWEGEARKLRELYSRLVT